MINIENPLGVNYQRHLVALDEEAGTLRDMHSNELIPLQTAPALATDRTTASEVVLALLDLAPGQSRTLERCSEQMPVTIRVESSGNFLEITNGLLAVRVPANGALDSGPLSAVRIGDGAWRGKSRVSNPLGDPVVSTRVVSLGPCLVQWETQHSWLDGPILRTQIRWAAGADTIQVIEEVETDSQGSACWSWEPAWPDKSVALCHGGGERRDRMMELPRFNPGEELPRVTRRMAHVSYFNQCHESWLGFAGDDGDFIGIFTGWGSDWQRRGHVWIDIMDEGDAGFHLHFPVKRGRRAWGLLLSTRAEAGVDTVDDRCLLNHRKTQLADLPLNKVLAEEFDLPLPAREPLLLRRADLDEFRERLAADTAVVAALDAAAVTVTPDRQTAAALAVWRDDRTAMREIGRNIAAWARRELVEIADGGYDDLIIFHGRSAKTYAYDLDVLWALDGIEEADYRAARKTLLAMAWMFADVDYCNPDDFWPQLEPDAGVFEKQGPHMGKSPVPPNFLAEFFSTTGVIAELFPAHPHAAAWRAWSRGVLDMFLEEWFMPDGTYRESVNYFVHCFNELLIHLCSLHQQGDCDYFAHPRVRGAFEHSIALQLPLLSDQPTPGWGSIFASIDGKAFAPMPANGNSGGNGHEQQMGAEFSLGAALYRQTDPELAGQCMHGWAQGGKLVLDGVHPMLTLLTLDPRIPPITPPWQSTHRQSLGLISKAVTAEGDPLWCLFRAGTATNHMDFDQGGVHLAFADRVLLGEHGYHTVDKDGKSVPACATYLQSTLTYAEDRNLTSGYTGVEQAPAPLLVHCAPDFDWSVLRIINTNYRALTRFPYNVCLPCPTTIHVRHYLFVKPDYFLLWDVLEEAHAPATFWLHPREAVSQEGPGIFRAGAPGTPHLSIHFLHPQAPSVVENEFDGPLWSLAVRAEQGQPFLVLLAPQIADRHIQPAFDAQRRELRVRGDGLDDIISLPTPGHPHELPVLKRKYKK